MGSVGDDLLAKYEAHGIDAVHAEIEVMRRRVEAAKAMDEFDAQVLVPDRIAGALLLIGVAIWIGSIVMEVVT
jgi:hypothetical protein